MKKRSTMSTEKHSIPEPAEDQRRQEPDPEEFSRAKEVIQHLTKIFSLLKIYPADNPFIESAKEAIHKKSKEFFSDYEELKLDIDEFSFKYKDQVLLSDEQKKKSLPFLFFKDGMRELSFLRGLTSEEMNCFVQTIKNDLDLPPEEGDIVNAIWEQDFPHIRFFALDEFLDEDIGEDTEISEGQIDWVKLAEGSILLKPEDREAIHMQQAKIDGEAGSQAEAVSEKSASLPSLKEVDTPQIDLMISRVRTTSQINELVTLLFEILFLEDRQEQFSISLNVLEKCHTQIVFHADFINASSLLERLLDLRATVAEKSEEKTQLIDDLLSHVKGPNALERLKSLVLEKKVKDFPAFFRYLQLMCPEAIRLAGELWEESRDEKIQAETTKFLVKCALHYHEAVAALMDGSRPLLTKEIITVLGQAGKPEVVPYLKGLASHPEKTIRTALILSLSLIEDENASREIIGFLFDKDKDVRSVAAHHLKYVADEECLQKVMQLAKSREFKKKAKPEKKAIFSFLASSQKTQIFQFLFTLMKKSRLFSRTKHLETRLCIVNALEETAVPEAITILKGGTRLRHKTIQQACQLALRRIYTNSSSPSDALRKEHV